MGRYGYIWMYPRCGSETAARRRPELWGDMGRYPRCRSAAAARRRARGEGAVCAVWPWSPSHGRCGEIWGDMGRYPRCGHGAPLTGAPPSPVAEPFVKSSGVVLLVRKQPRHPALLALVSLFPVAGHQGVPTIRRRRDGAHLAQELAARRQGAGTRSHPPLPPRYPNPPSPPPQCPNPPSCRART